MLFVQYPDLLKHLVSELLGIRLDSIGRFEVTNAEIPPEAVGEKFCRLDIHMTVDGQRITLEIQVRNEGDYPERVLYQWARVYSNSLESGGDYKQLPRTVIISIIDFPLLGCKEFHSEFRPLEITRHEELTDRMALHFFELKKLPEEISADNKLLLWLALFKADTEEELEKIKSMKEPVMEKAINAYNTVTVSPEFRELERLRSLARHNEAAALRHAQQQGMQQGMQQGKKEERKALVELLKSGKSPEEIIRELKAE